jgi:hypothetical protein
MKWNTRGGGAIDLFAFRCQGDPIGRLLQLEWRGNKGVSITVLLKYFFYRLGVNVMYLK